MPAPVTSWNRALSVAHCTDWQSHWIRRHWIVSRMFCCVTHSCFLSTQVLAMLGPPPTTASTITTIPLPPPPSPSTSSGTFFLPCFFFAERLFISAASRRLHAWGHIQRAKQRSPFTLREALFIALPRRGNQSPLLQIRGGGCTLTQKQSLMGFLCTSRAQCMSMIGLCYHLESPGGMLAFQKGQSFWCFYPYKQAWTKGLLLVRLLL